jgi:hypothetical protein
MQYLKIEDNKGYFLDKDSAWKEIDKITKEDLMVLLNTAIDKEFEMDEFSIETLGNKAHQIIYKNLHDKFLEFLDNKNRFKDESEQLYKEAIEKYGDNSEFEEVLL